MTNPKEEYGAGDARTTVLEDVGAATGIAPTRRPRLGFLGVGWIGRHRMRAIARSGLAEVAALGDASAEVVRDAAEDLEQAETPASCATLDELLNEDLDGLVVATPSALHASQAITALEKGIAVFCQKPLARTAEETRRVVDAARANDRLLGVDLSYRYTEGMRCIRDLVQQGELGRIYSVDLVFHNAYGPDKAWFHDRALSGGGCVIDLGIHLVDLALWTLGFPAVQDVDSRLYSKGELVRPPVETCEDYAVARLDTADGATIRLACSWNLPAGRDAVIEASFFGTQGGAAMRNVKGSFYDFVAERYRGTSTETLASPPDEWSGRAAVAWARQLAEDPTFDRNVEHLVEVAAALDAVYGR